MVTVVTGLWALQQAASEIGQGNVHVVDVVPPGEDPRTYELDPAEAARVRSAGLVIEAGGGFQPSFDAAAAGSAHVLDLSEADPGLPAYPWLSPFRMEQVARSIGSALERVDPAAKGTFANGEDNEQALLGSLDGDYLSTLGACPLHTIAASDPTFGLLDGRYLLKVVAIDGSRSQPLRPPQSTVEREVTLVRRLGVHEIYRDVWQPLDGLLEVQAEAGVRLGTLDPLTGEPPGGWPGHRKGYFELMEYNLQVLSNALDCPAPGTGA